MVGAFLCQFYLYRTMNMPMLLPDRQTESSSQEFKGIWFITIYIELQLDMQYIYNHYHTIFEHTFYIITDESDKKQHLSEDKGGMIINIRIWQKLDLLLVDPNNKGALYLQEQYGDQTRAIYKFRLDQDPLKPYNEVYEWVGNDS